MPHSNIVNFPRPTHANQPRRCSVFVRISRAIWRLLVFLLSALVWRALYAAICVFMLSVWLGRFVYGILTLGLFGKLWMHWGDGSMWAVAWEFGASLLIFSVLSAILAWAKSLAPDESPRTSTVRLSHFDRFLLVTRR